MKYFVLAAILAVVGLLFFGRGRSRKPPPPAGGAPVAPRQGPPAEMLACAHCGVHLPRADALFDAGGQPYCSPEHRVSGPR